MPEFHLFLLKTNAALVVFLAGYYFLLRRLTFYSANRWYFIFAIAFSVIYPFINLETSDPELVANVSNYLPVVHREQTIWDMLAKWVPIANIVFWAGSLVVGIRICLQLISLFLLHRRSSGAKLDSFYVRTLSEKISPFSFWRAVYLNPSLHEPDDLQAILQHEQVHVQQLHTADILLSEFLLLLCWFNPAAWIMRKAIKENLEFVTDQRLVQKGTDKKQYQYSLLKSSELERAGDLANNFNFQDLKKRFIMMNLKPSSSWTLSRYVILLPLLLIGMLAFSLTYRTHEITIVPATPTVTRELTILPMTTPQTKRLKSIRLSKPERKIRSVVVKQSGVLTDKEGFQIQAPDADIVQSRLQTRYPPTEVKEIVVVGYPSRRAKTADSSSVSSSSRVETVIGKPLSDKP